MKLKNIIKKILEKIKEKLINLFYFVRKCTPINYIYHRLFIKCHLVQLDLEKGVWYDTDTRLLYAIMKLFTDFIEKEKPFETCDYNYNEAWRKLKIEKLEIYNWWKNYDKKQEEIDNLLTRWYNISKFKNKNTYEKRIEKESCNKYTKAQKDFTDKETEMLIKVIKIRNTLWV